jgi:hypothetical protein
MVTGRFPLSIPGIMVAVTEIPFYNDISLLIILEDTP